MLALISFMTYGVYIILGTVIMNDASVAAQAHLVVKKTSSVKLAVPVITINAGTGGKWGTHHNWVYAPCSTGVRGRPAGDKSWTSSPLE